IRCCRYRSLLKIDTGSLASGPSPPPASPAPCPHPAISGPPAPQVENPPRPPPAPPPAARPRPRSTPPRPVAARPPTPPPPPPLHTLPHRLLRRSEVEHRARRNVRHHALHRLGIAGTRKHRDDPPIHPHVDPLRRPEAIGPHALVYILGEQRRPVVHRLDAPAERDRAEILVAGRHPPQLVAVRLPILSRRDSQRRRQRRQGKRGGEGHCGHDGGGRGHLSLFGARARPGSAARRPARPPRHEPPDRR